MSAGPKVKERTVCGAYLGESSRCTLENGHRSTCFDQTRKVSQPLLEATRVKLRHLLARSTPGVWKTWAMEVMSDQDGTSTGGRAVPVATTHYRDDAGRPRTNDADLICAMRGALPGLLDDLDAERDRADTAIAAAETRVREAVARAERAEEKIGVLRGIVRAVQTNALKVTPLRRP